MKERRNEWSVILAVGLIVGGVWLLLSTVLGPLFAPVQAIVGFIGRIAWPLTIIAIGVLLLVATRRGATISVQGRRLYRSRTNRMISGVFGGMGEYFGIDPTWFRVAAVLFAFASWFFTPVILYAIATAVIPVSPAATPGPAPMPQPEPGSRETVQDPDAGSTL